VPRSSSCVLASLVAVICGCSHCDGCPSRSTPSTERTGLAGDAPAAAPEPKGTPGPSDPAPPLDRPPKDTPEFINPTGRGPTGQWPAGFPAYSTAAELVTDGSSSGLKSAINNGACSDGCVIQHAGAVSGTFSSRAGRGAIVVRPPIGQRADYTIDNTTIEVDGLVFAGYAGGSGDMHVQNNGFGGTGSGYAWIDNDSNGGDLRVLCNNNSNDSYGFFYEVVTRRYAVTQDRSAINGYQGGDCRMDMVGVMLAGDPDPPPSHSDTLQFYNPPPGSEFVRIRDSVLWSSYDKVIQGADENDNDILIDNVFIAGPSHTNQFWPGPPIGSSLGGYNTVAMPGTIINSTFLGSCNPGYTHVQNSELYQSSGCINGGGNTTLSKAPPIPTYPTPAQLDVIWSP